MKILQIKAVRAPELPSGSLIDGRFEITDRLGRGGFSVVYQALDLLTGAPVALKLLDQDLPESHAVSILQRFEREASTLTGLSHPHIVQARAAGTHALTGQPYIAMDLLDGQGLDALLIRRGALSPARALSLLKPCLEALAVAHAAGIVHKDLKPSNFFIARPDQPDEAMLILDFGAATLNALPDARLTLNGEMIGTPQYLAPEYIRDNIVTCALDVYQLGLVLVEMLTGAVAVGTHNPALCLIFHSRGDLDIPAELRSSPLGPVLQRALALDPADRFPDAAALLDALNALDPSSLPDLSRRARGASLSPSYHGQLRALALDAPDEDATALIIKADPSLVVVEALEPVSIKALEPASHDRTWSRLGALLALLALLGGAALIALGAVALDTPERAAGSAANPPSQGADEVIVARRSIQIAEVARSAPRSSSKKLLNLDEVHRKNEGVGGGEGAKVRAGAGVGSRLSVLSVKSVESSGHPSEAGPGNLLDGDPSTVWAGCSGEARWVSMGLSSGSEVRGFVVALGYDLDLPEGGAPARVRVVAEGGRAREIEVERRPGLQRIALDRPLKAEVLRFELPAGVHALGELQIWGVPSGG